MRLRVLADIPESPLSDICQHPPPRLPIGRLKRSKIKKPPLAVKKTGCSPEQKELLWEAPPQQPEAPPQPSPRGGSPYLLCLRAFEWRSFPLGKVGMGLLCWPQKAPPQFPFLGKPERGFLGFSLVCTYATICIYDVV